MKVNPVRKIFSETDRAYLAGLIDGDGAIMACIEKHDEYEWRVRNQEDIKNLLRMFTPFMKVKRKQAELARKILESKINQFPDLLKVARLADALSQLNVRSKGRRKNFVAMIKENISPND